MVYMTVTVLTVYVHFVILNKCATIMVVINVVIILHKI